MKKIEWCVPDCECGSQAAGRLRFCKDDAVGATRSVFPFRGMLLFGVVIALFVWITVFSSLETHGDGRPMPIVIGGGVSVDAMCAVRKSGLRVGDAVCYSPASDGDSVRAVYA